MSSPTAGFDFTFHMRRLCDDLAQRLPELAHIEMDYVAIRFCQARKAVSHGLHASLTPLRFEHGEVYRLRGGRTWTIQRLHDPSGREMLYLLSFYLPRFLEQSFARKLSTVVHELWHISPRFDGDLRRHCGRCYAHSRSQAQYDSLVSALSEKWLALDPPPETYDFLRLGFRELGVRHGGIFGQRIATPKLVLASS